MFSCRAQKPQENYVIARCQVKFKAKHKLKCKTFHIREWCACWLERTHLSSLLSSLSKAVSLPALDLTHLFELKITPSELCCSAHWEEQASLSLAPPALPREAQHRTKCSLSSTTFPEQQTAWNCIWGSGEAELKLSRLCPHSSTIWQQIPQCWQAKDACQSSARSSPQGQAESSTANLQKTQHIYKHLKVHSITEGNTWALLDLPNHHAAGSGWLMRNSSCSPCHHL